MRDKKIKVRPFFVKCLVIEIITVFLILISVLIVKLTNKKVYIKIKEFYETYILDETSTDEVLKDGGKYEI